MRKLRLLVTKKCNKRCPYCCNKDQDLDVIPFCTSFEGYDEIMITGGEPTLLGEQLYMLLRIIRLQNPAAKVYLYTTDPRAVHYPIDGVTLTCHTREDVIRMESMQKNHLIIPHKRCKSFKLVVMSNLPTPVVSSIWKIKRVNPFKNCPVPEGEVFMKL